MNNKLYQGDCLEILKKIKSESIDMVITSPPYDNIRKYDDIKYFDFESFKNISLELKRVLKKGGVIVWIVNDSTIKGSETGTSFKQVLHFKEIGLRLHDTMIWNKNSCVYSPHKKSVRYGNIFEYMFIISKDKPKSINLIKDRKNKSFGKKVSYSNGFKKKGNKDIRNKRTYGVTSEFGYRNNIWNINPESSCVDKISHKHPAIFPEKLVRDHIITWSNENDIILDCFSGSGTTLKVSSLLKRHFIGIELNKNYIDIIKQRLDKYNIKYIYNEEENVIIEEI